MREIAVELGRPSIDMDTLAISFPGSVRSPEH
jgi:hypothetical protein